MIQILVILVPVIEKLTPIIIKIIERWVPDNVTKNRKFHAKRRVITRLTTISTIARMKV